MYLAPVQIYSSSFFLLRIRRPPRSALFPYPTLFRSGRRDGSAGPADALASRARPADPARGPAAHTDAPRNGVIGGAYGDRDARRSRLAVPRGPPARRLGGDRLLHPVRGLRRPGAGGGRTVHRPAGGDLPRRGGDPVRPGRPALLAAPGGGLAEPGRRRALRRGIRRLLRDRPPPAGHGGAGRRRGVRGVRRHLRRARRPGPGRRTGFRRRRRARRRLPAVDRDRPDRRTPGDDGAGRRRPVRGVADDGDGGPQPRVRRDGRRVRARGGEAGRHTPGGAGPSHLRGRGAAAGARRSAQGVTGSEHRSGSIGWTGQLLSPVRACVPTEGRSPRLQWKTGAPRADGRRVLLLTRGGQRRTSRSEEKQQMFERFTDRARRVVVLAQEEARMLNHNYIGTEHILLGLIHEGEGVAAKALESLGISLEGVRQQVEEIIGQGQQAPSGHIPFTPRAKKVLELSLREALQLGHNYIGTEHILLGLIREGEGVAAQVLVKLGADLNRVRQQVIQLLSGYQGKEPAAAGGPAEGTPSTSLVLDQFGRNLTQAARDSKLDQ